MDALSLFIGAAVGLFLSPVVLIAVIGVRPIRLLGQKALEHAETVENPSEEARAVMDRLRKALDAVDAALSRTHAD